MKYPVITSYPKTANILSMLYRHPCFEEWLFSNYIQVYFTHIAVDSFWFDFYQPVNSLHYPLIERQYLDPEFCTRHIPDFNAFLRDALRDEWYVYLRLCIHYISLYGIDRFARHEVFIYGYDTEKMHYYLADFFSNDKYAYGQAPFDEVTAGFNAFFQNAAGFPGCKGPQLLRLNLKATYNLRFEHCIDMFRDYVNGVNTSKKYAALEEPLDETRHSFGINCYKAIVSALKESARHTRVLKALHVLFDHKRLNHLRINYLWQRKFIDDPRIIDTFKMIEHDANVIRFNYLKYMKTGDDVLKHKVVGRLNMMMEREVGIFGRLIE